MPLVRCSQEFHKWVMEKASDGNPVSVVLDRMMAREEGEPNEKLEYEERFKKIDKLDKLMEVVFEELEGFKVELEEVGRRVEKLKGEGEKEEEEEKEELEKIKSEVKQDDQDSFICDCGEKVGVEENTDTSWLDGVEWVVCPNCNSKRRKEYLEKTENASESRRGR